MTDPAVLKLGAPKRPKTRNAAAAATLSVALIGGFEGLQTTAYLDVVKVPTVCYGETKNVKLGMRFTVAECQSMLEGRLMEFTRGIEACIHRELPVEVWQASISLAYNIGVGAFCGSSAVRLFNSGYTEAGCNAFMKWNRAGGVVWRGLTNRRTIERDLCLKGAA